MIVVKVGTSSLTDEAGVLDLPTMAKIAGEVAGLGARGERAVLVSSGAIAAGLPATGLAERPSDLPTLQALSAVGQHYLMRRWSEAFEARGRVVGQVLLASLDFVHRSQYLQARQTLQRLLDLGVVPVVNENDAVANDEIRYGDNDRLAALVAQLLGATVLVLLTDTPGVLSSDPRTDPGATLIEEVVDSDQRLAAAAGGPGSVRGSGGMASKVAAARMAAWSGVRTVIASARRPDVVTAAWLGQHGVGTTVLPRDRRLPARKLWIAFAVAARGSVVVDDGARRALVEQGRSLLPAGVLAVRGDFLADDAVEIVDTTGSPFAKGLVRHSSAEVGAWIGRHTSELPADVYPEVVHRDDLVVLVDDPGAIRQDETTGAASRW